MSGKRPPSLHIEWSPGRVRVLDTQTGRIASGEVLSDVSTVTVGHREAIIGIARGNIFLKTLSLPKATPEDLRRLVGIQIGQMFPLPADQLSFDIIQTSERTDEGFLTLIAAVRAEDLRLLYSELKRADLRPARIIPIAFGSAIVAARAGVSAGIVVEDSPFGVTLDSIQGGSLRFSRVVPNQSDIAREARRTLLATGNGDGSIIAVGGLTIPGAIERPDTALSLLGESPAFNFELAEERIRLTQRRTALQSRLSLLLMLSALLLMALVWVDRMDAQAVVTKGQGKWARELSKLRSIRDAELGKAQKSTAIASTVQSAFGTRQPLSDVAKAASDALPTTSWLTGLTMERGKPVQIRATTTVPADVSETVQNLTRSGRFREVKLVFANSGKISETAIVQYSINATAIGNLPMPEPTKKAGKRTNAAAVTSANTKDQKDTLSR